MGKQKIYILVCRMRHKRTQTQVECTCDKSGLLGANGDVAAAASDLIMDDEVDDDDEFDSEFDECEEDEAILKAMLLAQEYYLLYGDEGNITSCAKVEHDLMFRWKKTSPCCGASIQCA